MILCVSVDGAAFVDGEPVVDGEIAVESTGVEIETEGASTVEVGLMAQPTEEPVLSGHMALLHRIVTEAGKIAPGDLYTAYRERSDDPMTERTARNYLRELEEAGYIATQGRSRDRVYIGLDAGECHD